VAATVQARDQYRGATCGLYSVRVLAEKPEASRTAGGGAAAPGLEQQDACKVQSPLAHSNTPSITITMWTVRTVILVLMLTFSPLRARALPRSISVAESDCRMAREFLKRGNYEEACKTAEQAVRSNPLSADAESLAGQAELGLGHLDAAQEHLERALALQPAAIDARRVLGEVFLKQGRFNKARFEFQRVLASRPDDFFSRYSLGMSFALEHRLPQALIEFQQAYRLDSSNPALLVALLDAYIRLNQKSQASIILATLDRRLTNQLDQRMQIAALLVKENAYELAAEEFERLRAVNPDSDELNYDLALAYYRAGKEAQASALLRSLLARKDDPELEDLLGDVEERADNHAAAADAFRRAVQLAPENGEFRFDYAQCLEAQWDLAAAAKVFETGTLDFPSSAKMWLGLGATYYLAGRYEEAAQTLLQAARVSPDAPEVYRLLGPAYEAAGPFQQAIADSFSHYLSRDPPDAMAHYYYGKILIERNRSGESHIVTSARREIEEALRLDPNLAEAHTELGVLFGVQGQLRAARGELQRAVQLDPESSTAYYELARIYNKLGEPSQAQQALRTFEHLKATQKRNLDQDAARSFLARAKHEGL
jgi:tetratricopeptide (TPR) repeat protein